MTVSGCLRVNNTEAAAQAVCGDVDISVPPNYAVHRHLASGEIRRVLTKFNIEGSQIYALYPHCHRLSAKVRDFVDYLLGALVKEG